MGTRDRGVEPRPTGPVVVGVDGSSASASALRWAVDHAELTKNRLRAVMAWQPQDPDIWTLPGRSENASDMQARLALVSIISQVLGQPLPNYVDQRLVRGQAVPVLLDSAWDASLLVLGDRGRGGFEGQTLGSVSLHCVMHAACPVVVVPDHSRQVPSRTSDAPIPEAELRAAPSRL